jgi:hypothetical protein
LAANQKELNDEELSSSADQIVKFVIGKDGRGNKERDDDWLVQIVAKRVFRKLHGYEYRYGIESEKPTTKQLRPIVRSIIRALGRAKRIEIGHSGESEYIRIERKFKGKEGYYLARAGNSDLNEMYIERFESVCRGLSKLGIKTDFSRLRID